MSTKELVLPVNIAGVNFKNPFFVASGPLTKSVKQLIKIEECGWAAASIKLTIDPAPYVNRHPRFAVLDGGNALAFTAERRLAFEDGLRLVADAKKVLSELILFANITYAGEDGPAGWANMAKEFEGVGVDVIELNMCCPNMSYNLEVTSGDATASRKQTGASLGQKGGAVAEIVRECKKAVKIPVFVKITPEGGHIANVAHDVFAAGGGAAGGTANRLGIPPINLEDPASAIYHLQEEISMSCYSGAWLKPLSLRDTYEIRKVCGKDVRIVASGGIRTAADAIEIAMCGADLVGICAEALISGFNFIGGVIDERSRWLCEHGETFRGVRDRLTSEVKTALELTLYEGYASVKNPRLSAPCKAACPHHVPAQAYIRKVADGDFEGAYKLIADSGPMQNVCGYICDRECERNCVRGVNGAPVRIRDIKRFVLETGAERGYMPDDTPAAPPNGKRIAVVGGGPAGLSNAYYMRKAGYDVTVFEREGGAGGESGVGDACGTCGTGGLRNIGGIPRNAIPRYRLADKTLDDEAARLREMGIKFIFGRNFGENFGFDDLKRDGYDAVFLGIGAQKAKRLGIEGEDCEGVYGAVEFIKRSASCGYNAAKKATDSAGEFIKAASLSVDNMEKVILAAGGVIDESDETVIAAGKAIAAAQEAVAAIDDTNLFMGKAVVVIGGGFSAVDAARTAVRLGASKVYIAYRRTREEMPAGADEVAEAEAEGVKIIYLASPTRFDSSDGKVISISFNVQVRGGCDASGRRKPEEVDGAVFTLACDTVVVATGQEVADAFAGSVELADGLIRVGTDYSVAINSHAGTDDRIGTYNDVRTDYNAATEYSVATNYGIWDGFVFAGGDATGAGSVIRAVADGRNAAYYMDAKLSGGNPSLAAPAEPTAVDKASVLERSGFLRDCERLNLDVVGLPERLYGFDRYDRTMTPEEAVAEAKRCLKCGCGEGCALCRDICGNFAIDAAEPDEIAVNRDDCTACGVCFNLCPNKNIEMINTGKKI